MNFLTFYDLREIGLLVAILPQCEAFAEKVSGVAAVSGTAQENYTADSYVSFIITGCIAQPSSIFIWAEFYRKNWPKLRTAASFFCRNHPLHPGSLPDATGSILLIWVVHKLSRLPHYAPIHLVQRGLRYHVTIKAFCWSMLFRISSPSFYTIPKKFQFALLPLCHPLIRRGVEGDIQP